MGGRGASSAAGGGAGGAVGGNATFQILQQPPNIVATPQQAQNANARTFDATDNSPYHDLKGGRNYFQSQNLTIDQQIAVVNYLSPTAERGSLYSMSQNMNYAMATGQALTANQQYVHDQLMGSMHNLGENLNLTRYDHDAFVNNLLKQNGVNTTYDKMNAAQLKSALVGTKYGENKFISTSHNDFANAPTSSRNTFTTRPVKVSYKANANVQAMMPGNGAGGAMGEIVLAPSGKGKNFRIVDVRYTGNMARRKGTQSFTLPQLEIVVEATKQS